MPTCEPRFHSLLSSPLLGMYEGCGRAKCGLNGLRMLSSAEGHGTITSTATSHLRDVVDATPHPAQRPRTSQQMHIGTPPYIPVVLVHDVRHTLTIMVYRQFDP
ncbi:hypothetical protein FA95DRAFT_336439 [Auriscalpium vulgare]|uniref:Uncharacterized protein n=1 Tax=Auriscalpium vulgare TaxID=40419 RepID=A0ACB8RIX6_9AGAM|nr:hypothetical protein FA95DRAFT_336439 [Auriscalpium vulgare]